jgi:hypothetical protein
MLVQMMERIMLRLTSLGVFLSYVAAFVTALVISSSAMAQNLGTTFTDLWWNPAESGWGVTVDHQQNVMFLTFFIYQADGTPYWVAATLQKVGDTGLGSVPQVFTGGLNEYHGSWFGGPFNAATVTPKSVGTATFSSSSLNAATLQYSINGVNVTKTIQRQTLSNVNYSGQYLGGTSYTNSNCANPANNGTISDSGHLSITQSGTAVQITSQGQLAPCVYNGTYSQQGSVGAVSGSYTCADGTAGQFSLFSMQWTLYGMAAGVTGQNQFCTINGYLGGITGSHVAP